MGNQNLKCCVDGSLARSHSVGGRDMYDENSPDKNIIKINEF